MITANLWRIQPGASEVEVESWETGEPIKLELDPLKTPVEVRPSRDGVGQEEEGGAPNPEPLDLSPFQVTEGLYKRARKLRRAVQAVEPLLEAVRLEQAYLEEVRCSQLGLTQVEEEQCNPLTPGFTCSAAEPWGAS